MGPVMIDFEGETLTAEERELILHPAVGGAILFSRNYSSREQVQSLVQDVRAVRPELIIAVDHEGGRVQRFRNDFTHLPAMARIFENSQGQMATSCQWAEHFGWLMASELLAIDIDISFAPVLDLNGISEVIGDRAFHAQPAQVASLASSFIDGMHQAGMKSTGKHFPGHGSVAADSHVAVPVDERPSAMIRDYDMTVFSRLITENKLDAIMPAHVIYPDLDALPAGFSPYWLQTVLRNELGFDGVIFSDDLTMEGASVLGDYQARTEAALAAGCDMLLVCNQRAAAIEVLEAVEKLSPEFSPRLNSMRKSEAPAWSRLVSSPRWQQVTAIIEQEFSD
ncbi:beta-N-acetylhexosaminidase [Corallincola platygyrae]|uniref:Beta-hexosaminidase n=1 Tax=Corallincola platygyrae TaxID=1193278 RepID=A0ABW4XHG9_9GAMM